MSRRCESRAADRLGYHPAMCNLYALTKSQDEIRRLFKVETDRTGNLPPLPGIFPNNAAPIVHVAEGQRTLSMYRWGMPSPAFALKGKKTDPGVTNVRNAASPHWRRWLGPEHRCLVPLTAPIHPCGSRSPKNVRSPVSPASRPRAGPRCGR
jgi:putative SOS response-associated peptidase YedK